MVLTLFIGNIRTGCKLGAKCTQFGLIFPHFASFFQSSGFRYNMWKIKKNLANTRAWRGAGVVERARLEIVCGA
jgi:hypothetical protein